MKLPRFQFRLRTLMLVVTFVGVWTPLVMKVGEAIREAREAARRTPCWNNVRTRVGAQAVKFMGSIQQQSRGTPSRGAGSTGTPEAK